MTESSLLRFLIPRLLAAGLPLKPGSRACPWGLIPFIEWQKNFDFFAINYDIDSLGVD